MATADKQYVQPSTEHVKMLCGLHESIQGLEESDLDRQITIHFAGCENIVAFAVTEELFDSATLTARQAAAFADAVCYRVGARSLRAIAVQKVTGTQEPLLMEESERLMALATELDAQAALIEGATGIPQEPAGFALPSVSASGISVDITDWRPSTKLGDLNEGDDQLAGLPPGQGGPPGP